MTTEQHYIEYIADELRTDYIVEHRETNACSWSYVSDSEKEKWIATAKNRVEDWRWWNRKIS